MKEEAVDGNVVGVNISASCLRGLLSAVAAIHDEVENIDKVCGRSTKCLMSLNAAFSAYKEIYHELVKRSKKALPNSLVDLLLPPPTRVLLLLQHLMTLTMTIWTQF